MKIRLAIAVLAIGLLAPIPSWALDPNDWEADTTDARSFERVRERFRPSLEVRDYPAIFRDLERDLRSAPVWRHDESVYRRLEHAFAVLNQRFARYDAPSGDAAVAAAALDSFVTATPMGGYQFPCPGGECFAGSDVVTYDELEKLPDAKAADFLQRTRTVGILIVRFKRPALATTFRAIHLAHDRWSMFVEQGRSQYPWEVLANGWVFGGGTIEHPPMKQLVLAHPTAAVEMTTESWDDLRAKQALAIEAVGLIWYRWKTTAEPRDGLRWWGLSLIGTVRDDVGPGVGVLLHDGRMVTAGVTWHDDDHDGRWFDRPPFVIASFDLFQLAKDQIPIYRKKLNALSVLQLAKSSNP